MSEKDLLFGILPQLEQEFIQLYNDKVPLEEIRRRWGLGSTYQTKIRMFRQFLIDQGKLEKRPRKSVQADTPDGVLPGTNQGRSAIERSQDTLGYWPYFETEVLELYNQNLSFDLIAEIISSKIGQLTKAHFNNYKYKLKLEGKIRERDNYEVRRATQEYRRNKQ